MPRLIAALTINRDSRKSGKHGNHGSQNAVILPFFTIMFVLININGVIVTQKYLLLLLLSKFVCFVTYWLNLLLICILMLLSDNILQTKTLHLLYIADGRQC